MTKIQLLSLQDYILDPSPINLKLFVHSISPLSKPDKGLIKLIDNYKADSSKLRLKSIESYIGVTKTKTKKISYLPKKIDNPESLLKISALDVLKKKYMSNMNKQGSKIAIEENENLRSQIDTLEDELGLRFDYKNMPADSDDISKKNLLFSILGNWEDPSSISWELINGNKSYFEVIDSKNQNTSAFGMEGLLKSLIKFSGKNIRPFNVAFIFPQGNSSAKPRWTFSLNPIMSTNSMLTNALQGYNSELGVVPK